jgi:spore germination cell wall hydrolase CwlJ-like protein
MRSIILTTLLLVPFGVTSENSNPEDQAIDCLAKNMYYEARGEGTRGIEAVGHVTMNRVKAPGFPSSVCEVVSQKIKKTCQFSWVCMRNLPRIRLENWDEIRELAEQIYRGEKHDHTKGATHFHSRSINPGWNLRLTTSIGQHLFYRK